MTKEKFSTMILDKALKIRKCGFLIFLEEKCNFLAFFSIPDLYIFYMMKKCMDFGQIN